MGHDVFISHAAKDKPIADSITVTLEQGDVRCWIAPRDIRPGDTWGSSIVKAIESSKIMVIVFSSRSNKSQQVMREVERAVQKDVVVLPFRIENAQLSDDMEYFLSATHWLDAYDGEMEAHLQQLLEATRSILKKPMPEESPSAGPPTTESSGRTEPQLETRSQVELAEELDSVISQEFDEESEPGQEPESEHQLETESQVELAAELDAGSHPKSASQLELPSGHARAQKIETDTPTTAKPTSSPQTQPSGSKPYGMIGGILAIAVIAAGAWYLDSSKQDANTSQAVSAGSETNLVVDAEKLATDEKARKEAELAAKIQAEEEAEAKRVAEIQQAEIDADEKARREAEIAAQTKAKEETELKRLAEIKQAEKVAEEKAREEAELAAVARAEQEAETKRLAEIKQAELAAQEKARKEAELAAIARVEQQAEARRLADIKRAEQEARQILVQRGENGDVQAQYDLGVTYLADTNAPQNEAEAAKWFTLAADQGDLRAQTKLGFMNLNGTGVPQNDEEAVRWFRLSADQGDAVAQNNLGYLYEHGKGVTTDYAEAVNWYLLAAEQGNVDAQQNIGIMYEVGIGVAANDAEALKWYRLAAAQGNTNAQKYLDLLLDKYSDGVVEEVVE